MTMKFLDSDSSLPFPDMLGSRGKGHTVFWLFDVNFNYFLFRLGNFFGLFSRDLVKSLLFEYIS